MSVQVPALSDPTSPEVTHRRFIRKVVILTSLAVLLVALMAIPAVLLAEAIGSGSARYPLMAAAMAALVGPLLIVLARNGLKNQEEVAGTMQAMTRELRQALSHSEVIAAGREADSHQQQFETQLANALEMADGEPDVIDVLERALADIVPDSPAELLLADNSHSHLASATNRSGGDVGRMCQVDSPDRCPAARRAQVQRFSDSDDLDACPKLRGRSTGRCSAVCVPVSIMGRAVGVIHVTDAPGRMFDDAHVHNLTTMASLGGARIGLLRMMADSQLQAATDSLTGLLNRRSLDNKVSDLRAQRIGFTVVMADLDHFKQLNDAYGHDSGDRALRVFAQQLGMTLRSQDLICRRGGEEFAVVLPSCHVDAVALRLDETRRRYTEALAVAGLPTVTASFGVVEAASGEDLADALRRADMALFQAKREGRDRIIVHDHNGRAITTNTESTSHGVPPEPTGDTDDQAAFAAAVEPLLRRVPTMS